MLVPARAVMLACFILVVMAPLPLAMVEHNPQAQTMVLKGLTLLPYVILFCLVFHIPWLVETLKSLRIRIREDGWYRALMVSNNKSGYIPWPRHSDPIARKTQWGGLEQGEDVMRRGTAINVINPEKIVLKLRKVWLIKAATQFIVGTAILVTPLVVSSLVYEVPPAEIIALKQTISSLHYGFYIVGVFFLIFFVAACWREERLAVLDKSSNTIDIGKYRLFGLVRSKSEKPDTKTPIALSDIRGLQIISYKSKHVYGGRSSNGSASRSGRRKEQYELNLVNSRSQRTTLLKLHKHDALFEDAEKLAVFLNVPIWDRSFYYDPVAPQHANPLVQPL